MADGTEAARPIEGPVPDNDPEPVLPPRRLSLRPGLAAQDAPGAHDGPDEGATAASGLGDARSASQPANWASYFPTDEPPPRQAEPPAATRPTKAVRPPKPPKPPKAPKAVKEPKPPKPPRTPKVKAAKEPKPAKPARQPTPEPTTAAAPVVAPPPAPAPAAVTARAAALPKPAPRKRSKGTRRVEKQRRAPLSRLVAGLRGTPTTPSTAPAPAVPAPEPAPEPTPAPDLVAAPAPAVPTPEPVTELAEQPVAQPVAEPVAELPAAPEPEPQPEPAPEAVAEIEPAPEAVPERPHAHEVLSFAPRPQPPAPEPPPAATVRPDIADEPITFLSPGSRQGPKATQDRWQRPTYEPGTRLETFESFDPPVVEDPAPAPAETGRAWVEEPRSAVAVEQDELPGYVEYRPSQLPRYVFGVLFVATAFAAVVSIVAAVHDGSRWAIGMAASVAGLSMGFWWGLMAWSPTVITITDGQLRITQGSNDERFDLKNPAIDVDIHPDPWARRWRTTVTRPDDSQLVIRRRHVDPREFSALALHFRGLADRERRSIEERRNR